MCLPANCEHIMMVKEEENCLTSRKEPQPSLAGAGVILCRLVGAQASLACEHRAASPSSQMSRQ